MAYITGPGHPNPGQPYNALRTTAFLPLNSDGKEVCILLRMAFDARLLFAIGKSPTTEEENKIIWNGVELKTSQSGGSARYCIMRSDRNYNHHGQKSWDTFAFLGRFPIHTGPTPPLIPQTMLDACIQNFFRVSTLYRVGGGRTTREFRKGCTVLRGNREMTGKYEYCSTVPRTFVQDCSFDSIKYLERT